MMQELIDTLQKEMDEGAEIVTFTVVLKKNYTAYTVTPDHLSNDVYVDEV